MASGPGADDGPPLELEPLPPDSHEATGPATMPDGLAPLGAEFDAGKASGSSWLSPLSSTWPPPASAPATRPEPVVSSEPAVSAPFATPGRPSFLTPVAAVAAPAGAAQEADGSTSVSVQADRPTTTPARDGSIAAPGAVKGPAASPPAPTLVSPGPTVPGKNPFSIDFGDLGGGSLELTGPKRSEALSLEPVATPDSYSAPAASGAPEPIAAAIEAPAHEAPRGGAGDAVDATQIRGPSAAAAASTLHWTDGPTDVMKAAALQQRLDQMRGLEDNTPHPVALGARGNVFPSEAWSRFSSELVGYLRRAPVGIKLVAVSVILVPVAVGVALLWALFSSGRPIVYSTDSQPLIGGPIAADAYPQLGAVARGGRLEVLDRGEETTLVRDSLGRVGYVRSKSLRERPPPAVPAHPFADCARAPVESSLERCQGRAQDQLESCRSFCASDTEDPSCLEHCQKRFSDCLALCEQSETAAASAPAAVQPSTRRDEPQVHSVTAPAPVKHRAKRSTRKKKGR
jgi:hypothetical protein